MKAKSAFNSKTIWFNVLAGVVWLLGLTVQAADSGAVPEGWQNYAALISVVGNLVLRFLTTQPVQNPFG